MIKLNLRHQQRGINVIEPDLLLAAYAAGYFPMADEKSGEIGWYSPDPRAIIPLESFKISRSLSQVLKKRMFEIRIDTSFEDVIRKCGERDETWISEEIVQSYLRLHTLGHTHSVEAWQEGKLVGGLYGVALGAAFFGESMFSLVPEASKVALVRLVDRLKRNGFELLDTQYTTPHLKKFGTIEIPRGEYFLKLKEAVRKERSFTNEI